ncbi:MAG: hypothetical protein DMG66_04885 [Acidobacteria bacterium]|nr:MAG: hypothetical protein DMG66_04885 [Acidobacteriota bacterium]
MQRRSCQLPLLCLALALTGCGRLDEQQAKAILQNSDTGLQKTIFVDVGFLNAHCGQPVNSVKYALLQKAGILGIKPGYNTEVMTTEKGDRIFKAVGAQQVDTGRFKLVTGQQGCNLRSWAVPIASKQMSGLKITSSGSESAEVVYNWRWQPNEIGQAFTADSDFYRSLPGRQRDLLVEEDLERDLPLDSHMPHATRQHFVHDNSGWHLAK